MLVIVVLIVVAAIIVALRVIVFAIRTASTAGDVRNASVSTSTVAAQACPSQLRVTGRHSASYLCKASTSTRCSGYVRLRIEGSY